MSWKCGESRRKWKNFRNHVLSPRRVKFETRLASLETMKTWNLAAATLSNSKKTLASRKCLEARETFAQLLETIKISLRERGSRKFGDTALDIQSRSTRTRKNFSRRVSRHPVHSIEPATNTHTHTHTFTRVSLDPGSDYSNDSIAYGFKKASNKQGSISHGWWTLCLGFLCVVRYTQWSRGWLFHSGLWLRVHRWCAHAGAGGGLFHWQWSKTADRERGATVNEDEGNKTAKEKGWSEWITVEQKQSKDSDEKERERERERGEDETKGGLADKGKREEDKRAEGRKSGGMIGRKGKWVKISVFVCSFVATQFE